MMHSKCSVSSPVVVLGVPKIPAIDELSMGRRHHHFMFVGFKVCYVVI